MLPLVSRTKRRLVDGLRRIQLQIQDFLADCLVKLFGSIQSATSFQVSH